MTSSSTKPPSRRPLHPTSRDGRTRADSQHASTQPPANPIPAIQNADRQICAAVSSDELNSDHLGSRDSSVSLWPERQPPFVAHEAVERGRGRKLQHLHFQRLTILTAPARSAQHAATVLTDESKHAILVGDQLVISPRRCPEQHTERHGGPIGPILSYPS